MSIRDEYVEGVEYVRAVLNDLAEQATDREFDDAERAAWDEGRTFVEAQVAKIGEYDEREAQRAALRDLAIAKPDHVEGPTDTSFNVNTRTSPFEIDKQPWDRGYDSDMRSRAIAAVEGARHFHEDSHREAATDKIEKLGNSNRAAEQILWASSRDYNRAFAKEMDRERNHADVDIEPKEREAYARANAAFRDSGFFQPTSEDEARAFAVSGINGVLVPAHLDPSIILSSNGALNPYRQISRVVPISTNVWTGVSSAGITGGWTGTEASEVDDDTPTQAAPAVTAAMADAFIPFSFQAWEDWDGAESELMVLFQDYKDVLEESAFTKGSGSAQPYGIVTALASTTSWVSCATNSSFTSADLFSLKQALPARFKGRASFVMNEAYNDRIRQFGTSDGALYTVDLTEGDAPRILGKPAYLSTTMSSALSNVTQSVAVYGDFQNFLIADRIGLAVEFVPNLFHTGANRPSASRGLLAHWRVGADSIVDGAFRLLMNQAVTG